MSWGPMWPFFSPFRGSCCVKMTKIDWKSTFLAHLKLSMTGNFFLRRFLYVKCVIDKFFNLTICFGGLYDQFSLFSGGSCCVKMAKNDWKSRFLPPFDLSTTQNRFLCNFIHKMFSRPIVQPFHRYWQPMWPVFVYLFRGSCCVKCPKITQTQHFLHLSTCLLLKTLLYVDFILNMFSQVIVY